MINAYAGRNDYTAAGGTDFAYTGRILSKSHLLVIVTTPVGVATVKVVDIDYSVTNVGQAGGGNVSFFVAPTVGYKVSILLNVPATQLSDYVSNEGFPSNRIETDYDTLTLQSQMHEEQIGRAVKFAKQSAMKDVDLPEPTPNYFLAWNEAGTGFKNVESGFFGHGTGTYAPTQNYLNGSDGATIMSVEGSAASPTSNDDSLLIVQKWANGTAARHHTAYLSMIKLGNTTDQEVSALFVETEDRNPSANSFGMAVRASCIGMGDNCIETAYGGAVSSLTHSYKYLLASEMGVLNEYQDAPAYTSFDKNTFSACFLATSSGRYKVDAGFVCNPYNLGAFRVGFLVGETSVSDAAFVSRATTEIGLDLSAGIQTAAAIALPNDSVISAADTGGTLREVLRFGNSDTALYAMQTVNAKDALVLKRLTDTNPSGALLRCVKATGADWFYVDGEPPSSGFTVMALTYHNGTSVVTQPVTVGGNDSGGTNFKLLRVPN